MQRQHNLIISNGYYTTLTAIAILKQLKLNQEDKYLLAYFKQLENSFNENSYYSTKAWGFSKVINYNDYYGTKGFSFNNFVQSLKEVSFEHILIPINSSTKRWFKGLKEYYPKANFIFFEEGLISYLKPILDLELKKIINNYTCFYNDFSQEFLALIAANFKKHPNTFKTIAKENLLESLNDLKKLLNISFLGLEKSKNVLFLPQYYHNNNPKYNAKKLKEYLNIIKALLANGYKILLKDHPKNNSISLENYLNIFLKDDPGIINLSKIKQFPVELFLNDLNIALVFSVYSTTLFSASGIFNLPVFSSYKMLQERINSFSLYPALTCSLIKEVVPDLNAFLAYYRKDAKAYYSQFINNNKANFSKFNYFKLLIKFLLKS